MTRFIAIFVDFVYQSSVTFFLSSDFYCINDNSLSVFAVHLLIFAIYLFNFLFDQQRRLFSLKFAQQSRSRKDLHLLKFCFKFWTIYLQVDFSKKSRFFNFKRERNSFNSSTFYFYSHWTSLQSIDFFNCLWHNWEIY